MDDRLLILRSMKRVIGRSVRLHGARWPTGSSFVFFCFFFHFLFIFFPFTCSLAMAVVVVFFLVRINIYWIFFRRFHEYHSAVLNQLPGVPLRSVCLFLFDRHRLGFFLWIQQQKKRGVHNKPSPASFFSSSKTGQSYIEFLLEPLEPALFCLFFVFFVVFFVRWDQNWKWGSDARWHGTKETKRNAVPLLLTG